MWYEVLFPTCSCPCGVSVKTSVCLYGWMKQLKNCWMDFHDTRYVGGLLNLTDPFQLWLKLDNNKEYFVGRETSHFIQYVQFLYTWRGGVLHWNFSLNWKMTLCGGYIIMVLWNSLLKNICVMKNVLPVFCLNLPLNHWYGSGRVCNPFRQRRMILGGNKSNNFCEIIVFWGVTPCILVNSIFMGSSSQQLYQQTNRY
jgi:hypothetical protein